MSLNMGPPYRAPSSPHTPTQPQPLCSVGAPFMYVNGGGGGGSYAPPYGQQQQQSTQYVPPALISNMGIYRSNMKPLCSVGAPFMYVNGGGGGGSYAPPYGQQQQQSTQYVPPALISNMGIYRSNMKIMSSVRSSPPPRPPRDGSGGPKPPYNSRSPSSASKEHYVKCAVKSPSSATPRWIWRSKATVLTVDPRPVPVKNVTMMAQTKCIAMHRCQCWEYTLCQTKRERVIFKEYHNWTSGCATIVLVLSHGEIFN
ncbi:unnamed protein product [Timema podura]|uniref:Uncharacterized protein n=1 Tax=Timema podura TaxID=61482 RepID=A0ABN7NQ88_TIMPD|nr:unnamed protein product [Timema podura]